MKKVNYSKFKTNNLIPTKNYVLVGLTDNVGTTTISLSLLNNITNSYTDLINYIEVKNINKFSNLVYDKLNFDNCFKKNKFNCFFSGENRVNMFNGVNYIVRKPLVDLDEINLNLLLRKMYGINALVNIFDFDYSFFENSEFVDFFINDPLNNVYFIIDPLPAKIINSGKKINIIKNYLLRNNNTKIIVNKFNKGVDKKLFEKFIGIKDIKYINEIKLEELYKNEYNGSFPTSFDLNKKIISIFNL